MTFAEAWASVPSRQSVMFGRAHYAVTRKMDAREAMRFLVEGPAGQCEIRMMRPLLEEAFKRGGAAAIERTIKLELEAHIEGMAIVARKKKRKRYLVGPDVSVQQYQTIGVSLRLPHPGLVTHCPRCMWEGAYSAELSACPECANKTLTGVFERDKPERDAWRLEPRARQARERRVRAAGKVA